MSDQPKPTTGEWTVDKGTINMGSHPIYVGLGWDKRIADAHNAALAAERDEKDEWAHGYMREIQQLREQLAAELKNREREMADYETLCRDLREQRDEAIRLLECKRLEIWANAPDQPDIQEAVIKKLDLVHRHAIAAAQKPLVDELREIALIIPPKPKLPIVIQISEVVQSALANLKEEK